MYDELRIPRITCSMESFQELTGYIEGTVPFFDHILDHGDLEGGAKRLLSLVFPDWFEDELDGPGHIELVKCTDGITNKCIVPWDPPSNPRSASDAGGEPEDGEEGADPDIWQEDGSADRPVAGTCRTAAALSSAHGSRRTLSRCR